MIEALLLLFYLAVLAVVVGCFAYLRVHRGEEGGELIRSFTEMEDGEIVGEEDLRPPRSPRRDPERQKMWISFLILSYLLVFRAAVGSLCQAKDGGTEGRHRAVCEAIDRDLGFPTHQAPWTSLDTLILVAALGGTAGYWRKFHGGGPPRGRP